MKTFVNKIKVTKIILFFVDVLIIALSYLISEAFILEQFYISELVTTKIINSIIFGIIIYEIFLNLFEVYKNITIYESAKEYFSYALVCMVACNAVFLLGVIFNLNIVSPKENLLAGVFAAVMMIFYRVVIKFMLTNKVTIKPERERKNLLIIGGGEAGTEVVRNIKENLINNYNIVGIIDDNHKKAHCKINGVKILGDRNDILRICKERKIDIIFFAISNIPKKDNAKSKRCRNRRHFRKRPNNTRQ